MLEIEKSHFKIKFSEMNIRQRMYENESFITVHIVTDFYPSLAKEKIISGAVEMKLDLKGIQNFEELSNKEYEGDIGSVTISINNEGFWEHQTVSDFKVSFKEKEGREIRFLLETDTCTLDTTSTIVSLYTTSTDFETLKENFDMKDFHETCIQKKIGNSLISRYYVKD